MVWNWLRFDALIVKRFCVALYCIEIMMKMSDDPPEINTIYYSMEPLEDESFTVSILFCMS